MNIKCLFGFHKWRIIGTSFLYDKKQNEIRDRICTECGKLDDKVTRFQRRMKEALKGE